MKNIKDALRPYIAKQAEEAQMGSEPKDPYNKRFKKKLNRLYREEVGTKKAMYPEVDNWYERTRSRIVRAIRVRFKKSK